MGTRSIFLDRVKCEGGTELGRSTGCWKSRRASVEVRQANPPEDPQGKAPRSHVLRSDWKSFQEKPLSISLIATVPQTDTGGWVENTKALERTREKELGKLTP